MKSCFIAELYELLIEFHIRETLLEGPWTVTGRE